MSYIGIHCLVTEYSYPMVTYLSFFVKRLSTDDLVKIFHNRCVTIGSTPNAGSLMSDGRMVIYLF